MLRKICLEIIRLNIYPEAAFIKDPIFNILIVPLYGVPVFPGNLFANLTRIKK